MTKLILDLSESDMATALADCKPGEEVTFSSVTGKLVSKTDTDAVVDVTDVEYSGAEPAEPDAAPPDEGPADVPPVPPKKKRAPAVDKMAESY